MHFRPFIVCQISIVLLLCHEHFLHIFLHFSAFVLHIYLRIFGYILHISNIFCIFKQISIICFRHFVHVFDILDAYISVYSHILA